MMRKLLIPNAYNRRIRLSSREIVLALAVTFAAIAFVIAARHVARPPAPQSGQVEASDTPSRP